MTSKKIMRKIASSSLARIAAAAAVCTLTAGPASAENSGAVYSTGKGAKGEFIDHGGVDEVTACDRKQDGRGAVTYVYQGGSFVNRVRDGRDRGCTRSRGTSVEGDGYKIQVCLTRRGATLKNTCSAWRTFHNN